MAETTPEDWRPIAGYEGLYQVSSLGRVRSLDRVVAHRYSGQVRLKGRVLKLTPCAPWGYLQATLSKDGVERHFLVHALVTAAFYGPRPDGMYVLHGPGGSLDNRAVNLRWGTPRENVLDKNRDGTMHQRNRTHCPRQHPLVEPNLHVSTAKRGYRGCLACNRAISYARHSRNRYGIELDLQLLSDQYFLEIMETAAA